MNYLKIISLVILAGLISLSFRGGASIIDHPIIEDAYYTFSVAKNIANGNGISADGEHLTNGFQPLYTFMVVPAFIITNNDYLSIRLVSIFLILLFVFSGLVFASIIKDAFQNKYNFGKGELFWMSFFAYLSSTLFLLNYLNGLETGLMLFFLLVIIKYYLNISIPKFINILVLGLLLGLLVLSRIDAVFLVIIFSIAILFYKELSFKTRIIYALTIGIVSFIVSSPWWFHNYYYFGSIMPTSGQAQFSMQISFSRFSHLLASIGQNLVPHSYTFDRFLHGWLSIFVRFSIFIAIFIFIRKKIKNDVTKNNQSIDLKYKRFTEIISVLVIYSLVLVLWYFIFSSADYFYLRYLSPISLIGQIIFTLLLLYTFKNMKSIFYLLSAATSMLIIIVFFFYHTGLFQNKSQFNKYQLTLVNKFVPQNEYVAAGQSGTLGFFRPKVINMDGKVNNEVLKYKGRTIEYLEIKNIHWLCDWKFFTDSYLGSEPEKRGWELLSKYGDFYLYHKSSE